MSIPARLGLATAATDGHTLQLRRCWPVAPGHLTLEFVNGEGHLWAGQWFGAEPWRLHRVQRQLLSAVPERTITVSEDQCLILCEGGADRRLRPLSALVGSSPRSLVSHRAERRGVVMRDDRYLKVVKPEKAARSSVRGLAAVSLVKVRAPTLIATDLARGIVTWERLPGRSLHSLAETVPLTVWEKVGRELSHLHTSHRPSGLHDYDPDTEADELSRWAKRLLWFAPDLPLAGTLAEIERELRGGGGPLAVVHHDLHDKQILVDSHGDLGWIDFDTLGWGEPAVDLANLVVHLDLRVAQRRLTSDYAASAAAALIEGYRPTSSLRRRAPAYAASTRLRLFCLYAFRNTPLASSFIAAPGPASAAVGFEGPPLRA